MNNICKEIIKLKSAMSHPLLDEIQRFCVGKNVYHREEAAEGNIYMIEKQNKSRIESHLFYEHQKYIFFNMFNKFIYA